ncbi:MAG TPA: substrate-binding domain-containing protein [Solirubrobacteraceae bacterium]|nr:substrate-binding domain-containing protein [Solirubrobacteraceae bacterium]
MSTFYRRNACAIVATLVALTVALTACASSSAKSSSSGTAASASTASASCIPAASKKLPGDPNHVAATLTGAAKTAIEGYPGTVYKSPWANFKPKTKGPWKVGLSINQPGSYPQGVQQGLKVWAAQNKGKISGITVLQTSTPNSVSEQIQDMRTLLSKHVSVIFAFLSSPTGLNAVIDQAAKQGVPVISIAGSSTDKNAINLQPNPTQLGYDGAAGLVNAMGGKSGSVLVVHGIPGITFDSQVVNPGLAVLKACHDTIAGSLTGYFVAPSAKSATLQYLSSHPATVNGVFEASGMASGVISAFQQLGRTVPPVADVNPVAASLVYWQQHESSYNGSGVAIAPERTGEYSMAIALALLEGRGIKITDVPFAPPIITKANLSQWVQKGWTASTTVEANGPTTALPIDQLVNEYATK